MTDPFHTPLLKRLWRARTFYIVMTLFAGIIAVWAYLQHQLSQIEPEFEFATVISYGTYADYDGNHPTIIIQVDDGTKREIPIGIWVTRSCKVGDRILLQRRGSKLRVAPEACRELTE